MSSRAHAGSPLTGVPVALAVALHVLVLALGAVVVVNAPADGFPAALLTLGLTVVFLGVWFAGAVVARAWTGAERSDPEPAVEPRPGRVRRAGGVGAVVWLLVLCAVWLALILTSDEAIYLVFPLFFVLMHVLPGLRGVLAVAAATAVAIVAFALHRPDAGFAGVLGPVLGAAVAVVIARAYRALMVELRERQRLIEDLTATRSALAEAERAAGVEAERARLAREIHDTVSQSLSSIIMLLHAADRAPEPQRGERIGQARQAAQDALAETRQFIRELQPAALHGRGIAAALARLAETARTQSGIAVELHLPADLADLAAVPTPVEVGLLRVAQNAVANVQQHAHAHRLDITLSRLGRQVVLDVVDDGVGFDVDAVLEPPPGAPTRPGGRMSFGLRGVRERVAALGGDLMVESNRDEGTSVVAVFDLDAAGDTSAVGDGSIGDRR
ncbi:hypothetical protein GCM10011512_15370 [Tersicoccus solisilvae]|uniref:Histidine kinase/HSP90-like ATPase domain-containing protein n=1 Tax=Tersicoccus solisilvae TaxID=1882339 RepID=A0ABQ1P5L3_9MICC|nr:sensor histidine kinase [Tersicoccus solisilvae]GGC89363.1 hypothetical protein GCM10011512_15370 [Tersicoccus solisilvae]